MSDKEQDRTTSHAKSIHLDSYEEKEMDRVENIRSAFDRAKEAQQEQEQKKDQQDEKEQPEKSGSQMVQDDRPQPQLTPDGQQRQEPDRESYNERLAQERETKKTEKLNEHVN